MPDNRGVLPRFYAPDLVTDSECMLPSDESHHLSRVMRLGPGDQIAVFDGRGAQYRASIVATDRERVVVRVLDALPVTPSPAVAITLVQAILKGGSMDDAVRDATMMGVAAIEPLISEHVDVKSSVALRPGNLDRWRRVALASVKQSGRARLPAIREPRTFDQWIASPSAEAKLMFVEPSLGGAASLKSVLGTWVPPMAAVLVGPEGGWSPREVTAAVSAGCVPVSLGPLTIRAESMAVAALAAVGVIWEM